MIFLLPIYKEPHEQFLEWFSNEQAKEVARREEESGLPLAGTHLERATIEELEKNYQPHWEQNQASGWIQVFKCKGGFSFRVAKAISKKKKVPSRHFELLPHDEQPNSGKLISFTSCQSEADFIKRIDEVIDTIVSMPPFKGHLVDLSPIKELSPHLNWHSLIS